METAGTTRSGRNIPRVVYSEDTLAYPDGPATEDGHFDIEEYCLTSADHLTLCTVDNLVVQILFASKQHLNSSRVHRAVLPDKFPETFDAVSMLPPELARSVYRIVSHILSHPLERTKRHQLLQTIRFTWLCALSDPEQEALSTLLMSEMFERTLFRYIPFSAHARVRMGGVLFQGEERRQCCVLTTAAISKDVFLWELNGILSTDEVHTPSVSIIVPHVSQRMPTQGPRIMAGPARFVNHCCRPNAVVRQVSSFSLCHSLNTPRPPALSFTL